MSTHLRAPSSNARTTRPTMTDPTPFVRNTAANEDDDRPARSPDAAAGKTAPFMLNLNGTDLNG